VSRGTGVARALAPVLVAALTAAALAGCTGTSRSGSDAPGVPQPAPAAAGPAPTQDRMSITSASAKDLAATLRANGVDDPEHWAKVVSDNKPYPAEDPALGKLRTVLQQAGLDPANTQRILDVLAP
jgi:hypothetical protein